MTDQLRPGDALIIVDVQNDFVPGGSLPIAEGHAVVPVLNEWIAAAQARGLPIYATRDWHPVGHVSFAERDGPWPVHCVQETPGAEFHPDLSLPPDAVIVSKGTHPDVEAYSGFDTTDLARRLRETGVERVWIGGLAQDVCVRATALDALAHGLTTHVIAAATRPVKTAPGDAEASFAELEAAGAHIHRRITE